jgi:nicotinamide riboside transporter PnuC
MKHTLSGGKMQKSAQTNKKMKDTCAKVCAKKHNILLRFILRYFVDWTLYEKIWLSAFTLITIGLFFAWHDTWIGLVASLSGMLCVVLAAKGKISNYYIGIINILFYSYAAYLNKYYGEVQLNMLFLIFANRHSLGLV